MLASLDVRSSSIRMEVGVLMEEGPSREKTQPRLIGQLPMLVVGWQNQLLLLDLPNVH